MGTRERIPSSVIFKIRFIGRERKRRKGKERGDDDDDDKALLFINTISNKSFLLWRPIVDQLYDNVPTLKRR